MNWTSEYSKPLFATVTGHTLTLQQALHSKVLLEKRSPILRASASDQQFSAVGVFKAASMNTPVTKQLVIQRLKADPQQTFRFLDGREFNAEQAAAEVERESTEGKYFMKIEKRTVAIVQEAFARGEIRSMSSSSSRPMTAPLRTSIRPDARRWSACPN